MPSPDVRFAGEDRAQCYAIRRVALAEGRNLTERSDSAMLSLLSNRLDHLLHYVNAIASLD